MTDHNSVGGEYWTYQTIPDQLVLKNSDHRNTPVQHIELQPCTGVSYVSPTSGVLHNLLMIIVVENDPGKSIVTEGMSRDCEQNNPPSKSFVTKKHSFWKNEE